MKKDKQQGVSFDKLIFEKINLELYREYKHENKGNELGVDISLDVGSNIDKSHKLLVSQLGISVFKNTENRPFYILVKALGFFSVKDDADVSMLEEFSKINAPTIIFPFVRETIADLTMKTGFPPLLLPPDSLVALIEKSRKNEKK